MSLAWSVLAFLLPSFFSDQAARLLLCLAFLAWEQTEGCRRVAAVWLALFLAAMPMPPRLPPGFSAAEQALGLAIAPTSGNARFNCRRRRYRGCCRRHYAAVRLPPGQLGWHSHTTLDAACHAT